MDHNDRIWHIVPSSSVSINYLAFLPLRTMLQKPCQCISNWNSVNVAKRELLHPSCSVSANVQLVGKVKHTLDNGNQLVKQDILFAYGNMGLSWGVFPLPPEQHTGTEEIQRVRNAGLRNCRRTQGRYQHHQDCRKLLGNRCSYKTCAAGSTFSPVNHDGKHINPFQTTCLVERCWSVLIWVCWASAHLAGEGRSALGTQLETGTLISFSECCAGWSSMDHLAEVGWLPAPCTALWQLLLTKKKRNHLPSTELFHLTILIVGKDTNSISLSFFPSLSRLIIKMSWDTLNN